MACEDKKKLFEDAMAQAVRMLEGGLRGIAADAEARAKAVSYDFKKGNDLAVGVGATAGTVVGGVIGGPAGAAAGVTVGKVIGALFVMNIGMRRTEFKLDVPETTMRRQDWSFDSPVIVMKDKEMSWDMPVPVMQRVEGPPNPRMVCKMVTKEIGFGIKTDVPECTLEWEKTYLDMPGIEMQRQRIVMGVPEIRMVTQHMALDLPEFTMKTQTFSFDVPYVTIELAQDAGKKAAAAALEIAQGAQAAAQLKQANLREELRFAVVGPCTDMFDCYRGQLQGAKQQAIAMFDPQITQMGESVKSLLGQGVPEDSVDLQALREALQKVVVEREKALKAIDDAITQLAKAAAKALDGFINQNPEEAMPA